ncbi:MAG: rubrerythrin [Archaeoglobus sp.]|uniref:ferritin family protein n=1 Tax=Archaeoglobus sp. TaxID=1872626 RepID=UPI001D4E608F|nr:ferritin family protein [Archaeoglobus sp.]MBO8181107.1 rubrerythrin [Archaeoglobus sp.]MBO8181114.1 rubrerythrin [Archaeoglobus sp.]
MEVGKLDDEQKLMRAIELELEAIRVYLEMAKNTEDPELIKLFHSVAYEEKVHVGEFMAMLLKRDRKFREGMVEGARELKEEPPEETIGEEEEEVLME